MTRLLHVISSPRRGRSASVAIGEAFTESFLASHPGAELDVLDLWSEPIPPFDGDRVAAKMTVIGGQRPSGRLATVWDSIGEVFTRFDAADRYLFGVPMWNGGVPWVLKQYIDTVTQPGLLFSFDPDTGYSGLLTGKRAAVIYTSSVYEPGRPKAFGHDHQSTFFGDWLRFAGIDDISEIRYHRTSIDGSDGELRRKRALAEANDLAATF